MARSAAARIEESVPAPTRAKRATASAARARAPRANAAATKPRASRAATKPRASRAATKPRSTRAAAGATKSRAATAAPAKPRPSSPRRRSGPVAQPKRAPRPAPRAARAPRQPLTAASLRAALVARGHVLLDRLLRGRVWVVFVGVLLAGIVFLNVGLLQLNDRIARTDRAAGTIGRENGDLRLKLAKVDSTERIQRLAEARGFVMPAPGAVRYVRGRSRDAREAARRMTAPEPRSAPVPISSPTASGAGTIPSVPATGASPAATGTTPAATQPAPATTTPPAAAAAPAATTAVP